VTPTIVSFAYRSMLREGAGESVTRSIVEERREEAQMPSLAASPTALGRRHRAAAPHGLSATEPSRSDEAFGTVFWVRMKAA
jgi:hypothetical protein